MVKPCARHDPKMEKGRGGEAGGDTSGHQSSPAEDLIMLETWRQHATGLAPHYPILYALILGMGAQSVFEFGVGGSTAVMLAALSQTGGRLYSCSPDAQRNVVDLRGNASWVCHATMSDQALKDLPEDVTFDLVLHDGSHSTDVVVADLLTITPRIRDGGLLLVHDVLHSYVGPAMRAALAQFQWNADRVWGDILLPFGFGLAVFQFRGHQVPVSMGPDKPSSPHHTTPFADLEDR